MNITIKDFYPDLYIEISKETFKYLIDTSLVTHWTDSEMGSWTDHTYQRLSLDELVMHVMNQTQQGERSE